MKIIGILNNYQTENADRAIFLMADSSLLKDGKPFFLPDFDDDFRIYPSLVVRICRLGKNISSRFASRYYDAFTIGLNVRAEKTLRRLVSEGLPWAEAVSFDSSAILGDFISAESTGQDNIKFSIEINGHILCQWSADELNVGIDRIIEEISSRFTLKIGDLIYIGFTGEGCKISIDDHIEGVMNGNNVLKFNIK